MNKLLISSLIVLFALGACSRKVTRVSPDQQIDISGRWNDTDSKLVAEEMIRDVLSKPWYRRFQSENDGKTPVVIVGDVVNKSFEHISSDTFIKDVERELINSGQVRIVQNAMFREALRDEKKQQQTNVTPETRKKIGVELGADFMLFGTINSIVDEYKKEKVINYKVNLELSNLETTETVWIGDKEIKKYVKN
ncbi:penicillin-binding protein activator LpoB [Sediminitomix flava]|nr:penicillin-binding protein activator LpoB [Sediminitomix flava]